MGNLHIFIYKVSPKKPTEEKTFTGYLQKMFLNLLLDLRSAIDFFFENYYAMMILQKSIPIENVLYRILMTFFLSYTEIGNNE